MEASARSKASPTSFEVKLLDRGVVKASGAGDRRPEPYTLTLSNFDYLHPYPVCVVYFYRNRTAGSFSSVASTLRRSLAAALEHFPPLAGRIVPQPETGLPEISCNDEGAEFIEAYVDVSLARLDICYLDRSVERIICHPPAAEITLSVQLTGYACGGFSIFWTFSHMAADARAFGLFLSAWSEISRGEEISRKPCHDRQIFPARSLLSYSPLLDQTYVKCTQDGPLMNSGEETISLKRLYYVEGSDVDRLREIASEGGQRRRTRVEAFSAYVWKMVGAAAAALPDTRCRLGWAVDGRPALGGGPAAFSGYFGNVISMAVGEMNVGDLYQSSLPEVSQVVSQTLAAVKSRSHFLDLVDWIEQHKPGLIWPRIFLRGGGSGGGSGPVQQSAALAPLVVLFPTHNAGGGAGLRLRPAISELLLLARGEAGRRAFERVPWRRQGRLLGCVCARLAGVGRVAGIGLCLPAGH